MHKACMIFVASAALDFVLFNQSSLTRRDHCAIFSRALKDTAIFSTPLRGGLIPSIAWVQLVNNHSKMIIDAHQHFWHYDAARDAWITDAMAVIRRDFLPADLEKEFAANGVDGCVAVQADQSEAETRFLLDLAARHPFIKGVVGWVD